VNKKSIKSDLAKVDRMKDSEIDYSDIIPPLDKSFYTKATQAWPPAEQLPDVHQSHFARRNGKPAATAITRHTSAEEERPTTQTSKTGLNRVTQRVRCDPSPDPRQS
jgi:hypothetical protein